MRWNDDLVTRVAATFVLTIGWTIVGSVLFAVVERFDLTEADRINFTAVMIFVGFWAALNAGRWLERRVLTERLMEVAEETRDEARKAVQYGRR